MEKSLIKITQLISELKQKHELKREISQRMDAFRTLGKSSIQEIFKELCFCILTANYTAEGGIRIQKEIGNGFLSLSEKQLRAKLKKLHYRFPNIRAKYLFEARAHMYELEEKRKTLDQFSLRSWLVQNIKGLGWKEASHLLRNIGYEDIAIIDFHVVDFLVKNKLIKRPKAINSRNYSTIEKVLRDIAKQSALTLAELDLYLWYYETGKVLK
jgi:N-glycosylase/DNA lyase